MQDSDTPEINSPVKKSEESFPTSSTEPNSSQPPEKGPVSFFSGAVTSLIFSWLSLLLSRQVVLYFSLHTPTYSSPIAQSVASGFKTLIIGIAFLSTFTFGFIGLGLTIVFIRSLLKAKQPDLK